MPGSSYVILLPPSEGKAIGGKRPPWSFDSGDFPQLQDHRAQVALALASANGGDAKLLGAKGDLLCRCQDANVAVQGAATLPTFERYTGVLWAALLKDLPASARKRASSTVLVPSALTGLSAWNDPVPDFRLKFSVSVAPLGRLDAFWKQALTKAITSYAQRSLIIDLLPNEHEAAWTPPPGTLRPVFTLPDGKPAAHASKVAKGLLAKEILISNDPIATLHRFMHPGLVLSF